VKKEVKIDKLDDAKDYAQKKAKKVLEFLGSRPTAVSTTEANRVLSTAGGKGRSELFVDVNEYISITFNSKVI
jgi:hypothetical protein